MKKILKWRLKEQPSTESLLVLVSSGLLTKDEAREILFSSETEEEIDVKSLKAEIKFLRELVQTLSSGSATRIIETIREVEKPWRSSPWYNPYLTWSTNADITGTMYTTTDTAGVENLAMSGSTTINSENTAFADIKTF